MSQGRFQPRRPKRQSKTHDYTQSECGIDYIFEIIEEGERGYMTGQKQGIKCGDYVLLPGEIYPSQYQVEKIDYYCNHPDMWIALLKKVSIDPSLK